MASEEFVKMMRKRLAENRVERNEDFYEKMSRIIKSPDSRLFIVDVVSRHQSTYRLMSSPGKYAKIEVETLCAMEVINAKNPPCFICAKRGKICDLLHNRPEETHGPRHGSCWDHRAHRSDFA